MQEVRDLGQTGLILMGIGAFFALFGWGIPKIPDRYWEKPRESRMRWGPGKLEWQRSVELTPEEAKRWMAPVFLIIGLMLIPVGLILGLVGWLQ